MNYEKRIRRVARLYQQAIEDQIPHKMMQGYYLLTELNKKQYDDNYRKQYLEELRNGRTIHI